MENKICLIYTTIDDYKKASDIAKSAISKKISKCVNIIDNVTSIYEWEGKIEESKEYIMIFKTLAENRKKLLEFIEKHHPYEIPAIICLEPGTSKKYYEYLMRT